jgi:putative hydrolase of HD superfamily
MPDEVAEMLQDLTGEYEDTETIESKVAHDADKVETLMQAREYGMQGYATGPWEDTSIEALRTESGKQLAQAIVTGDPHGWWSTFASSYHELRAASRARQDQRRRGNDRTQLRRSSYRVATRWTAHRQHGGSRAGHSRRHP